MHRGFAVRHDCAATILFLSTAHRLLPALKCGDVCGLVSAVFGDQAVHQRTAVDYRIAGWIRLDVHPFICLSGDDKIFASPVHLIGNIDKGCRFYTDQCFDRLCIFSY